MNAIGKTAWIVCLVVGIALSATGGEWPADDETAQPKKTLATMTLDELRAFQAFFYISGGRDPMTMRLPPKRIQQAPEAGRAGGPKPALTPEEMESFLVRALAEAEVLLTLKDYDMLLKTGGEAIRVVEEEWPPLKADPPQLRQMFETLLAYRRTAERLKRQEEVTAEFNRLNIHVQAILWSPTEARIVVNGMVAEAGEKLRGDRGLSEVRVEAIEPKSVLFVYRGQRFRMAERPNVSATDQRLLRPED